MRFGIRTLKLKANFSDVPALWQLAQVLLNCLTIVWIPLDGQKDNARRYFESLNDKGMPLTASELLCNYLFRPIIEGQGELRKPPQQSMARHNPTAGRRWSVRRVPAAPVFHR